MRTDAEIVKELMENFNKTKQSWLELYGDLHGFTDWFTRQVMKDTKGLA